MGPRPLGRGRLAAARCASCACLLQWGRDLSAAEGTCSVVPPASGPALQWGRDLSAAEGVRVRDVLEDGRASMGPRPLGRGRWYVWSAGRMLSKLQWGRDLSAAEGEVPHRLIFAPAQLQWGRDLSAAEGANVAAFERRRRRLQWGRDLSAAEGTRLALPRGLCMLASMGPRPLGRGRAAAR